MAPRARRRGGPKSTTHRLLRAVHAAGFRADRETAPDSAAEAAARPRRRREKSKRKSAANRRREAGEANRGAAGAPARTDALEQKNGKRSPAPLRAARASCPGREIYVRCTCNSSDANPPLRAQKNVSHCRPCSAPNAPASNARPTAHGPTHPRACASELRDSGPVGRKPPPALDAPRFEGFFVSFHEVERSNVHHPVVRFGGVFPPISGEPSWSSCT